MNSAKAVARELLTAAASQGDAQSARMLAMMDRGEGMFANKKKQLKKR